MLKGRESVIFDPFKGTGLPEPKAKADIVLCSHGHSDHNNAGAVKHDKSVVLEGFTGTRQIDSVSIKGVATFHDDAQGVKRGRNSVYIVGLDNITFCHLGDLGQALSSSQIGDIGSIDVLFLPVGGFYTIGPEEARKVMDSLKPRITVPMHYRMHGMSAAFDKLSTVEDFIRKDDNAKRLDGPSFTVAKADLAEKAQIVIPKLS
jgi:L-ascorbate metabolism protein UlaG (beta-lactamase superfamily)